MRSGWLEVIVGCMFSGKTEELIRQLKRCEYAKLKFQVFKPKIDNRYSDTDVASHNQNTFPSIVIESATEIYQHLEHRVDVIGIDEAQFFNSDIVEVCNKLASAGKRVIVAGLDTDWQGQPFGPIPQLMALAEVIRKQHAICVVCGEPANRTQRLVAQKQSVLVGSTDFYEARCRRHFDPELSLRLEKLQQPEADVDPSSELS